MRSNINEHECIIVRTFETLHTSRQGHSNLKSVDETQQNLRTSSKAKSPNPQHAALTAYFTTVLGCTSTDHAKRPAGINPSPHNQTDDHCKDSKSFNLFPPRHPRRSKYLQVKKFESSNYRCSASPQQTHALGQAFY